ncbi:polyubiquitin-like [Corylus avellana]|uniref:polyubiquitin-like n=1 Tax=Corylus avellana TaxID=13451 RepID=UPI00286BA27D|nr:polyubiquitin-like [Corylus avellana]
MASRDRNPSSPPSSPDSTEEEICLYANIIKTVALKVKRHETISNIKALLLEKADISENLQELFLAGNRLMNDQRLVDYGIQQDSTVDLVLQNACGTRIYVKSPLDHKNIAIEARSFDTIQNIKSIIQAKEGIQPDQYTLIHNGKVLEDERILSSLNSPNEITFHLVFHPKDGYPIFVRTVDGEMLKLEVKDLFTIRDVKTIVESMTSVNFSWVLIYARKQLEDCKTLASYEIKEEAILEMFPKIIQIFATTEHGRTVALDVELCETIKDVKDQITFKLIGFGASRNHCWDLFYAGKQLEDGRTLASYDIREEAFLKVYPTKVQIFVRAQDRKIITLDVELNNTIKDVEDKIYWELTGDVVNEWNLIYAGKQLEVWRTLASYDIKDKAILEIRDV